MIDLLQQNNKGDGASVVSNTGYSFGVSSSGGSGGITNAWGIEEEKRVKKGERARNRRYRVSGYEGVFKGGWPHGQ